MTAEKRAAAHQPDQCPAKRPAVERLESTEPEGSQPEPAAEPSAEPAGAGEVDEEAQLARVMRAQFWYYQDAVGSTQGPFYPGQMRQWYDGGFFTAATMVGSGRIN